MKWPSYTQEEIKKVTEVIKSGKVIGRVMRLKTLKKSSLGLSATNIV
jgi:dTDP-4-amino-4,6-dideoxygalactose transaminase